jgi:preprotein translocase subunit YajC
MNSCGILAIGMLIKLPIKVAKRVVKTKWGGIPIFIKASVMMLIWIRKNRNKMKKKKKIKRKKEKGIKIIIKSIS